MHGFKIQSEKSTGYYHKNSEPLMLLCILFVVGTVMHSPVIFPEHTFIEKTFIPYLFLRSFFGLVLAVVVKTIRIDVRPADTCLRLPLVQVEEVLPPHVVNTNFL